MRILLQINTVIQALADHATHSAIVDALLYLHQNVILPRIHVLPALSTKIVVILIQTNIVSLVLADLVNQPAISDAISSPYQGVIPQLIHAPPAPLMRIATVFLPIPTVNPTPVSPAKQVIILLAQEPLLIVLTETVVCVSLATIVAAHRPQHQDALLLHHIHARDAQLTQIVLALIPLHTVEEEEAVYHAAQVTIVDVLM